MRQIQTKVEKTLPLLMVAALLLVPALAGADDAEGGVAAEIKAMILADNAYTREHLMDREGGTSKEGSLEFWSSGGLLQWVPADSPISEYEDFSLTPKHIKVIELPGGEAAVALYYAEGRMHPKGGTAIGNYRTRVLQVFIKEDGKWVARASHWSPIQGGAGTSQTSVD